MFIHVHEHAIVETKITTILYTQGSFFINKTCIDFSEMSISVDSGSSSKRAVYKLV